jgi:hypothetical protein
MGRKMAGGAVGKNAARRTALRKAVRMNVTAMLIGLIWVGWINQISIAQVPETSCRQTNALTGIYVQPSLESSSRGVLPNGQTVRLEMTSSGTGWARVTEPLIGWVEAKYLTPATACTGVSAAQPATAQSAQYTAISPATLPPNSATAVTAAATVTCDVLPAEGLVVRSEPTVTGSTALQTIPKGTYQFQFTNDHVRSHSGNVERQWAYITAPYQGWIAVGTVGGQFNLGGKSCG